MTAKLHLKGVLERLLFNVWEPATPGSPSLPAVPITFDHAKLEYLLPPALSESWTGEYRPTTTMSSRLFFCRRQTCQTLP